MFPSFFIFFFFFNDTATTEIYTLSLHDALPIHRRFHRYTESAFADLKNSSVRGQAIPAYAAGFLERFAGEGPWAHVDMAGPAYLRWARPDYLHVVGGTGYGVRLIAELARSLP